MDLFNPDINNLLKSLNNKRSRTDTFTITTDNTINELKLSSLVKLEELLNSKKYTNRELSKMLDDLETSFSSIKMILNESYDIDELNRNMFTTIMTVHINMIIGIRKNMVAKGRDFNFTDYVKNERKKLLNNKNKPIESSSKRAKKEESDSEYSEYDEYDDDDESNYSDTIVDEDDYNHSGLLISKLGRDFIDQLYGGKNNFGTEEEALAYFSSLNNEDKNKSLEKLKEINSYQAKNKPMIFRIMDLNLPLDQKNHILKNYLSIVTSRSDNNKLKQWIDAVMTIPFGIYKGINIKSLKTKKIIKFLNNLQVSMDNSAWGHNEAKRQIIQMMGQQIKNPKAKGNMLGLWGPPGNGKTTLIKEGIAKAMDKPFIFISLGGATDSSFLEGHSYTYEGSVCGRIVNGLITAKCMDPIIYFDELDKISKTSKGDEITNILIHLTDPVQNNHFRDKYFHGLDIDLSNATMIFSFNDPSNVNHVLLDRITTVETKYLLVSQKIHITKNYLLPNIFKEMLFEENSVIFDDNIIDHIIDKYTHEGGIRKLKSLLYNIIRELNLANLMNTKINNKNVVFPFTVELPDVRVLLKHKRENESDKINLVPKVGIVNGLYANTMGTGGVLPIECVWIPTSQPLQIKATGSLEKVIKESTEVASSVAWNHTSEKTKQQLLEQWKTNPMGFHIHCPDGSTPKDGPSAGGALTLVMYSLITNRKIKNDVAMTGEINLQGYITAIGGLENKLQGAKKAGCKTVLIPKENVKDLKEVRERNPFLIDDTFSVIDIEFFSDIIKYALLPAEKTESTIMESFCSSKI